MRKKTYKKIGDKIEETDVSETTKKEIYNIGSLKKKRDYFKEEYKRLNEILKTVGEE